YLGLDASAVALDFGRLCLDEAREFAYRVVITAFVDQELPLLRCATLRFIPQWCSGSIQGARGATSKFNHQRQNKHRRTTFSQHKSLLLRIILSVMAPAILQPSFAKKPFAVLQTPNYVRRCLMRITGGMRRSRTSRCPPGR